MRKSIWPVLALVVAALVLGCAPSQTVKPSEDETRERRIEAEKSYSIGAGYYAQKSYNAAMENFERAVEIDSTYYEPYIAIGNVWRKRRDPVQAEEAYRNAMRLNPGRVKGYEALGDLFLEMSVVDSTLVDSALAVYKLGLEKDSSLVDLYNGIAEVYLKLGQTEKADSVYQKARGMFPDDLSLRRLWAEFVYKQKRYAEAVGALLPLVAQFPEIISFREKLAFSYAELKQYEKAVAQLDTLLVQNPTNKQALLTQGVIFSRQGKYKSAVEKFRDVLNQDSTYAVVYVYIAEAMIKQGRYGAAETELRKALKFEPGMASAYAYLGDINRYRGKSNISAGIAAASTAKLNQAKTYYEAAKSYYQRALSDPAYGSYVRPLIQNANQNIRAIEKELFVR